MSKILLIMPLSTLNWGEKNNGGVDSVCQMLVRELAKSSGHYFYRVLAFDPFCDVKYTGEVIHLSKNIEVVLCPSNEKRVIPLPGIISTNLRVLEQIKIFKPDIVHTHIAPWLIGVNRRLTRIATLHSYKKIGRKSVSKLNDFFHVKLIPWICNRYTDQYTCVGEIIKESLLSDTNKPIALIENPIANEYFSYNKHRHASKKLTLVTCALITRRKRIEKAIDVIFFLNSRGVKSSLNVIGPISDKDYYNELIQKTTSLKLTNDVVFSGALNRDEIVDLYKTADFGVFCSEEETFGLAPMEMLAAQLPLITTKVGVFKERYFEFKLLGVVFFEDIKNDEELLSFFIDDHSEKLDSIVKYIEGSFSAPDVIRQYENLYSKVIV